jgi:hypothetical protein
MKLTAGKLLLIMVLLYVLLATPWYIPKVVQPFVFGIPLWVVLTVAIILAVGYALVYVVALKIEKVMERG